MTATAITTAGTRHATTTLTHARRIARGAGSVLAAIAVRWSDFVDSGQLGPSTESATTRRTGTWI